MEFPSRLQPQTVWSETGEKKEKVSRREGRSLLVVEESCDEIKNRFPPQLRARSPPLLVEESVIGWLLSEFETFRPRKKQKCLLLVVCCRGDVYTISCLL